MITAMEVVLFSGGWYEFSSTIFIEYSLHISMHYAGYIFEPLVHAIDGDCCSAGYPVSNDIDGPLYWFSF